MNDPKAEAAALSAVDRILAEMERDIEDAIVRARKSLQTLDKKRAARVERAADNVIDILEGAARVSAG